MPILVAACVLAAVAWVYLLVFHGGYWRTGCYCRWGTGRGVAVGWPSVVAVIRLGTGGDVAGDLPSLVAQGYPGSFRSRWWMTSSDGDGGVAESLPAGARCSR
jgi:hypothetical protein